MAGQECIGNLDSVRGLAVLGILVVNIMAFAWPMSLLLDPASAPFAREGIWTGSDQWYHWVDQVFFRDRFRNLFTLLFGVSIFLVGGERSDVERGRLLRRRLGWLAVIGLIHGLALWYGDILLFYAWCGLFAMLARSLSGKTLVIIGAAVTAGFAVFQAGFGLMLPLLPPEMTEAMQGGSGSASLAGEATAVIAQYHAGYGAVMMQNLMAWLLVQLSSLFMLPFSTVPIMMLGVGLYKLGFFHGRMKNGLYWALISATVFILAVRGWAFALEVRAPPTETPSYGLDVVTSALSVIVTLGYAAVVIKAPALFRILAPVGQMAFTTYLGQSVILASIFYLPFGPEWFGRITPGQLWPFILGTWIVQIVFAHLWLKRFRWGPLEWVWRSLTHGQRLQIRKSIP